MWEPIHTMAAGVRAGEIDPVELTERAIARAKDHHGLNAVVHLDEDGARRAAANTHGGPLAGIPVLVKEIMAVEGWPWTCGSGVFAGRVAERDAEVVRRVRAAGAVVIGLSHSHEFAYGCTGASNVVGPCRNPHDRTRITGGSSSGSAAVAAGIVPLALGTDTAGSVRIPAALCGVVGAMPARGTLPADGVFPLSETLDRVGVLARSVVDARTAVSVLSGVGIDAAGGPPRLGVLADFDDAPEVAEAYRRSLEGLAHAGATVGEVHWPQWTELAEVAFDIQGPEAAAVHAAIGNDGYQPDVLERLRVAAEVPGWRYVRARQRRSPLADRLGELLSTVDAVIFPTSPIVAPLIDAVDVDLPGGRRLVRDLLLRNNRPVNATGYPALSVPIPSDGLPVAIQVIATGNDQAFRTAEWIQKVLTPRR